MDGDQDYGIGDMRILEDDACPANIMYIYNNDAIKRAEDYTTGGPQMAEEDGKTFRFRPGTDSLTGFLRYWSNLIVYQRNAVATITNLSTPTGII
jgi:hypothetical protein